MSIDLSAFNTCAFGSASFQLEEFEMERTAVVKEGSGRTGTKWVITGKGFVDGDDTGSFAAKVAAVSDAFNKGGKDFVIVGLGGVKEVELLASVANDHGPHATTFKMLPSGPLRRDVQFKVEFSTGGVGDVFTPVETYKEKVAFKRSGQRSVTRRGELTGAGSVGVFTSTTLPAIRALYPWPNYAIAIDYETSDADNAATTYNVTVTHLLAPLPSANGVRAVDGEVTERSDRDEMFRLTTTRQVDFAVEGDPLALLAIVRPTGVVITRETVEITRLQEGRLRATFVTLKGADGNVLMNYESTVKVQKSISTWEEITFEGADPIAVEATKKFQRVMQTGSAVTAQSITPLGLRSKQYLKPPEPMFPDNLLAEPEFILTESQIGESRIEWSYSMFVDTGTSELISGNSVNAAVLAALTRPSNLDLLS